ncbi:PH domain-containing protein, partial [Staphylococcus felis]|uniref:PH domain-containing protein n=1 Tax=Staphylococcus felis TaxID=46127 RepID=UPI0025A43007
MYSPQKLHPISYITGIIDVIKQNIFLVIIFVFFQMKDFDFTKLSNYIAPAIVTFFFLIGFVKRVIEVFKTRYWIEDNHFIVTSGLFNYERKELNIRRIQSIDTTQNLVHQIVGGVRLIIKTPSDGIDLETVTKEQSERIRLELERLKSELLNANEINQKEESEQTEEPGSMTYSEPQNETIYELSTRNLLLMAMTSGAIFVALLTIGPLFGSINEVIPWDIIGHRLGSLFQTAVNTTIFVVITILIISYIVGVLINFIRYFGYTLRRKGELLNIRYGLL